jgi:glucose-1-phosphate thymidylyltransferase
VAELDDEGAILNLVEKPKEPKSNLALVGIYFLRKSIFPIIKELKPSWRNELEITDAIENLRKSGKKVHAQVVKGWWKDTGKPEDILEANHLILDDLRPSNKGEVEVGAELKGKVGIGEGTIVKRGSVLRGPIIVGKNCTIGPDTYIGPYTSIGDDSKIIGGDIEASIIMENTSIECRKKIINSLIGKGSVILSSDNEVPKGDRLILGECSRVVI